MRDEIDDEKLMPCARAKTLLGGVSDMFLYRRITETKKSLADRGLSRVPENDASLFPLPAYIAGRRFFNEAQLLRYLRHLRAASIHERTA